MVWPNLRYYTGIFLEGLKKTTKRPRLWQDKCLQLHRKPIVTWCDLWPISLAVKITGRHVICMSFKKCEESSILLWPLLVSPCQLSFHCLAHTTLSELRYKTAIPQREWLLIEVWTPTISSFTQSLHAHAGLLPQFCHNRFLPSPFHSAIIVPAYTVELTAHASHRKGY